MKTKSPALSAMQIFDMHDTAGKIGAVIGTLVAISVYCLLAYGLFLGLFH